MNFQSLSQKLTLSALAVCALAFAAQAQAASAISPAHRLQSLPASTTALTAAAASTLVVDVTGIQSMDEIGAIGNTVATTACA